MRNKSLYTRIPNIIPQKLGDPLGDYPRQFRTHLESREYSPGTLRDYILSISALGTLMQQHEITIADLDEAEAVKLFSKAQWPPSKCQSGRYMVRSFVRFLIERGAETHVAKLTPEEASRGKLIQDCVKFLRDERGLVERTVGAGFSNVIDFFLKFRFGHAVADLSKIRQIDIVAFMQAMQSPEHPTRVTLAAAHLRRFFRFLLKVGKIETNLALGVPRIARRGRQQLPRHLPQEQVNALVAAVRSDTPRGRRNHAIMLLLARLGLRPPEVIAIQIDDIDWRAGEIIIRGKGQLHDRVPLPQDVGEALAAYIRLGRITKSRSLFVSMKAPHRPFKSGIVLNGILKEAYRKTGLKTPSRNVGSYVLRHSLATNLVRRGASLDEIANVLRHRSRKTTMHYAKLDIDGLRSIAQPWPVAGGAK